MKKEYTAPYAEKVNFNYKDQVVASDAGTTSSCFFEGTHSYSQLGCVETSVGAMNN